MRLIRFRYLIIVFRVSIDEKKYKGSFDLKAFIFLLNSMNFIITKILYLAYIIQVSRW